AANVFVAADWSRGGRELPAPDTTWNFDAGLAVPMPTASVLVVRRTAVPSSVQPPPPPPPVASQVTPPAESMARMALPVVQAPVTRAWICAAFTSATPIEPSTILLEST